MAKNMDKRYLFNVVIKVIVDVLEIKNKEIGLSSESTSRNLPAYSEIKTVVSKFKDEALNKEAIIGDELLKCCKKLYKIVSKERVEHETDIINAAANDCNRYIEDESYLYSKIVDEIELLNLPEVEYVKTVEFTADLILESFYISCILRKKMSLQESSNENTNENIVQFKNIFKFNNTTDYSGHLEKDLDENASIDIYDFAYRFEENFEKGYIVSILKNSWSNKKVLKEILIEEELIVDEELPEIPDSYSEFRNNFLKQIIAILNDKAKKGSAIVMLIGMIVGETDKKYLDECLSIMPKELFNNFNSFILEIDNAKKLPYDYIASYLYRLFVPLELILQYDKEVREIFEDIIFKFESSEQVETYFEALYVINDMDKNFYSSHEAMLYGQVQAIYDMCMKYYRKDYEIKKLLGVWFPFKILFQDEEQFDIDCETCINAISDKAKTKSAAMFYVKQFIKMYKVLNNERMVAVASKALFNLYCMTEEEYEKQREDYWSNLDDESKEKLKELELLHAELDNLRNN